MTRVRGLVWLAAIAFFAESCDKTLTFDDGSPAGATGGGGGTLEPPRGGSAGTQDPHEDGGAPGSDGECAEFCGAYGLACFEPVQTCVECVDNYDCYDGLVCDPDHNRCVSCTVYAGCEGDEVCDGWSHQCLESCATEAHPDRDCRDEKTCDLERNVCIFCMSDEACQNSEHTPFCLTGGARCVECTADRDCYGDFRYCDLVRHECVECLGSRDCPEPFVCHPADHVCFDIGFSQSAPPPPPG